ncbi:hypothetical protein CEUSTIGMA_g9364.t1 [Chlamydomonas eustigma]|uniref:Uncharacterized protein n=1 Tax=Chlamydomonas eustigma TaxID=1157962 RepID=A0A250XFY0_9CHLO|nr:hypothetical protein CEUSTIGMA_g9364.t1 [Chlamydomonas eustigma]|eukprot:GAX81936.1 hypothetical protein CEUSTIGMA_g9364.t1 [Chlamydomonas eustigma]
MENKQNSRSKLGGVFIVKFFLLIAVVMCMLANASSRSAFKTSSTINDFDARVKSLRAAASSSAAHESAKASSRHNLVDKLNADSEGIDLDLSELQISRRSVISGTYSKSAAGCPGLYGPYYGVYSVAVGIYHSDLPAIYGPSAVLGVYGAGYGLQSPCHPPYYV